MEKITFYLWISLFPCLNLFQDRINFNNIMKGKSRYTIILFASLLALSACTGKKQRTITVLCEKGTRGDYEVKWEIYPEPKGDIVEIYASDIDSVFFSTPVITAKSDDYIAAINLPDSSKRQFFQLKVGDTRSGIVSNRFFKLDSIHNFRDIGGYYTADRRQIRWGKIFRSGGFKNATQHDIERIKQLSIKTHIDIREKNATPLLNPLETEQYYNLPIGDFNLNNPVPKILNGQFLRGDAVIYTQDLYKNFIDNYTEEYAIFFDYLCDESNYPILYSCFLGKEQVGLATYFLLLALGVPTETIEDDYMASNRGINKSTLMKGVSELPESSQEALSLIANADISYIRFAISCIRKKKGSVEAYMLEDLKLTSEKKEKLRQILLYNVTTE